MIVGRDRELHQLRATLARVAHDAGAVVVLAGEAGVGKSHLLAALVAEARALGFDVALGRAFSDTAGDAFAPWREALGEDLLARWARSGSLGAGDDRARAFEGALAALRERAAHRPLVVAIEDLHWADRDSLRLFLHLARFTRDCALLLVGTLRAPDLDAARHDALDAVLAELTRDDRCERFSLRPFAQPEVADYAAAVVGAAVPQSLAAALHAETGGNALYVRELLRHLLEDGALSVRDGRLVTDVATAELGLPPSVRHVVRQRVARLSPAARALLRCASVANAPLDLAALRRAAAPEGDPDPDPLGEVTASGLLRAAAGRYEFTHALVRRAVYDELDPDRRAQLHRRVAEALVAGASPDHAEVAAHYHASRELPGAGAGVTHALAAAAHATAAGAHERAAALLALALELADASDRARVAEVAARLAVARAGCADVDGALAATRRAVDALTDRAAVASALATIARALEDGGAPRSAWEPLVREGLAATGDRRDLTWGRLRLLERRVTPLVEGPVWVSYFAGHDPEAVRVLRAEGSTLDFAATVEPHEARPLDESAALAARARGWSDPAAALRVLDACGRDQFFRGDDFHRTVASMESLRAEAERVGSATATVAALVVLGCSYGVLGELAAARDAWARATAIGHRLGAMHRMNLVGPLAVQTVLGYVAGTDWSAVAPRFIGFVSSPQVAHTPFGLVALSLGLVGTAFLGDADTVARLAPHHLRALDGMPSDCNEWGAGRDCGATAAWRLGLRELAPGYLALARREVAHAGGACWSCAEESAARMSALLGDLDGARRGFDRARERYEATGRRPLLGVCDYDEALAFARNERGDDPRVATLLDRADERFGALGMDPWLDSSRALRAALAAGPSPPPDGLTRRELEVLVLLAQGHANKDIAARLFISVPTVERHVANVYEKTGERGRAAATAYALRRGLLPG